MSSVRPDKAGVGGSSMVGFGRNNECSPTLQNLQTSGPPPMPLRVAGSNSEASGM
jgi:hypothetical protein